MRGRMRGNSIGYEVAAGVGNDNSAKRIARVAGGAGSDPVGKQGGRARLDLRQRNWCDKRDLKILMAEMRVVSIDARNACEQQQQAVATKRAEEEAQLSPLIFVVRTGFDQLIEHFISSSL